MDDAAAGGVDVARATAAASARLAVASGDLAALYGTAASSLGALAPTPILATPGGVPLIADGRVVGGIGIGGASPEACAAIAAEVAR